MSAEVTEPFASLSPATAADVAWAQAAVDRYPPYRVGVTIPRGHDAYVRALSGGGGRDWWEQEHPELLRRPAGDEEPPDPREYRGPDVDGDADLVDALVPHLRDAMSPGTECVFGIWDGFGVWRRSSSVSAMLSRSGDGSVIDRIAAPGRRRRQERAERRRRAAHDQRMTQMETFIASCPVLPAWGGRDMFVVRGPLEAVSSIGSPEPAGEDLRRLVPQLWWPDDHAWTVAHEIDHPWLYVGGSLALIDRLITDDRIIAVVSHPDDPW